MSKLTPEEEKRKKAIFDSMSAKSQKRITNKGYDDWDPFDKPKDPLDMRMHNERITATMLTKKFLATRSNEEYSNDYGRGVFDICMGIIGKQDRFMGMYEFSCWYYEEIKKGK